MMLSAYRWPAPPFISDALRRRRHRRHLLLLLFVVVTVLEACAWIRGVAVCSIRRPKSETVARRAGPRAWFAMISIVGVAVCSIRRPESETLARRAGPRAICHTLVPYRWPLRRDDGHLVAPVHGASSFLVCDDDDDFLLRCTVVAGAAYCVAFLLFFRVAALLWPEQPTARQMH